MKDNKLPKRKGLRLSGFDYSNCGVYFITLCTKDRKKILSRIVEKGIEAPVGVGALDDPRTELTQIGKIVEDRLLSSGKIPGVKINEYVIMPNHIHVIIWIDCIEENGSSWAPTPTNSTIPHVISTFKRFCGKDIGYNIFQRGYMDHIIRNTDDYDKHQRYIRENPRNWYYDELYSED